MYRRICGLILAFLLLVNISNASVVKVLVTYEDAEGKKMVNAGSGVVYKVKGPQTVVVTAGHMFMDAVTVVGITVQGKDARCIFREYTTGNNGLDLAILYVNAKFTPQFEFSDPKAEEQVLMSGYVDNHIVNLTGGKMSPSVDFISGQRCIGGQSGGPVLASRLSNGQVKYVCVGVIIGRGEPLNLSVYTPFSKIDEKLKKHVYND